MASTRPPCGSSRTQPKAYRLLSASATSQAALNASPKPSPGSCHSGTAGGSKFAARSRSLFSRETPALRGTPCSSQLATTAKPPSASESRTSPLLAAPASFSSRLGTTNPAGARSPAICRLTPWLSEPTAVSRVPPSAPASMRTLGPSSRAFSPKCFFSTVRKLCSVRRGRMIGGGIGSMLQWEIRDVRTKAGDGIAPAAGRESAGRDSVEGDAALAAAVRVHPRQRLPLIPVRAGAWGAPVLGGEE